MSARAARRRRPRFAGESARMLPKARIAGPMPWVMAIMTALSVLAMAAGLALANVAAGARSEIQGGITVQIVEGAPAERERQTDAALTLLGARADVSDAQRVPDEELERLLEPWLGDTSSVGDAAAPPTPTLIDVQLAGPVDAARLQALRSDLRRVAPSARLDAQAGWLAPVFATIRSFQLLATGLVVLLGLTTVAAVWLAARSALGSNRDTIDVIHLLGGTDGQIARVFQRSIGIDAGLGALAGLLLGVAAILVLGRQLAGLGSGLIAGGALAPQDWIAIALVPIVGVLLAIVTARITVIGALRRML